MRFGTIIGVKKSWAAMDNEESRDETLASLLLWPIPILCILRDCWHHMFGVSSGANDTGGVCSWHWTGQGKGEGSQLIIALCKGVWGIAEEDNYLSNNLTMKDNDISIPCSKSGLLPLMIQKWWKPCLHPWGLAMSISWIAAESLALMGLGIGWLWDSALAGSTCKGNRYVELNQI